MLFQKYARGESFLEMLELHALLFGRNDLYELIPESYFADGRASFDNFDVVILPYVPYFPDGLADKLGAWVRNGGLLIAAGPFAIYDKLGFDKAGLWREVMGQDTPKRLSTAKDRDWHWALDGKEGGPDLVERAFGKGKVIVALRSLRDRDFREANGLKIAEAVEVGARPVACCASNDFEMTVHQADDGRQYLCVMNRNVDEPVTDTVVLAGEFKRGVDLDVPGGFPVAFRAGKGQTSFPLRLAPAEFTMIALEK
jgi:hypothetical protein